MWIRNTFVTLILITLVGLTGFPVLADDTSQDKTIGLTINWIDDSVQDRPDSMTIELIRTVDDQVYPMDSKTLNKSSFGDKNNWTATFEYLYGEVWEYSFKITQIVPETALYQYQFIESGNGTNEYTFDYIYGRGDTEMTIITRWEGINEDQRTDSLNINLFSFKDNDNPQEDSENAERSILTSGTGDTWTARVSGLNDNPDNYFLVVTDLPDKFSSTVTKGDSPNVYINTITPSNSVAGQGQVTNSMSKNVSGVITAISPNMLQDFSGVLNNLFLNFGILLLIGLVSIGAIIKHRRMTRERRYKK